MWEKNFGLMQSRLQVMKERMGARAVDDSIRDGKEGGITTGGVSPSKAGACALSTRELEFARAVSRKLSESLGYNPVVHALLECPLPPPVPGPKPDEPRQARQMVHSSFTSSNILMVFFAVALVALLGGQILHR